MKKPYNPIGAYLDFAMKPLVRKWKNVLMDDDYLPTVRYGGATFYNPVTMAQFGLQEYSLFTIKHQNAHLAAAIKAANWLVANQDKTTGKWYYSFDWVIDGKDATLKAPWASALAQGQSMSLLTRMFAVTSEQPFIDTAELSLQPLKKTVKDGGLTVDFHGHPYYEEYPTTPPPLTLNGFMFTLIGLYDLKSISKGRDDAGQLYTEGLLTLLFTLPYYDTDGISASDLLHLTKPPRQIRKSRFYNEIHVVLLEALNSIQDHPILRYYARKWASKSLAERTLRKVSKLIRR